MMPVSKPKLTRSGAHGSVHTTGVLGGIRIAICVWIVFEEFLRRLCALPPQNPGHNTLVKTGTTVEWEKLSFETDDPNFGRTPTGILLRSMPHLR